MHPLVFLLLQSRNLSAIRRLVTVWLANILSCFPRWPDTTTMQKHDKGQHIDIIERGKMRLKSREPCSHSVHWTILGPNRTVTSWGNCFRLWPAYPNIQVLEDSTAQIDGIDIVMPGLSSFHALTCRLAICGWMEIKRCASPAWNNSSCSSIPHLRFCSDGLSSWMDLIRRCKTLRHTLAAKFWPGYNK